MIKNKFLLAVFATLASVNFVIVLFVLNIWYVSPGHRTKWSHGTEISERIQQRNILGHRPGPGGPRHQILYVIRNSGLARNNSTKITGALQPQSSPKTDPKESFGPILDIFHKALFGGDSIKRLAIKNKRLDRIYDVWNVTFNPHRNICSPVGRVRDEVIAVVNTAPANFAARKVIRNTWGKEFLAANNTRLVFFLGRTNNFSVQQNLESEMAREGDIVRAEFQEDYRNLTLKSVLLLRWVDTHCPGVSFVLKVDDDVFVNSVNLLTALEEKKTLRATIFGKLASGWTPVRNRDSHYFVPESGWAASIYPDFVAGPAYVLSGDAVPLLLQQVSSVPYFFLEDVYVTGMCAQRAGVARLHQPGFRALAKPLNPCTYHRLVTAHGLNPREMAKIWRLLAEYGPEAKECWEETCVWNWLGICVDKKRTAVDFWKLSSDGSPEANNHVDVHS